MTVRFPSHPLVTDALTLATTWFEGHLIGGAPALGHALRVARTLCRFITWAPAEAVAAALLHDAPDLAPDPSAVDTILSSRFGPAVSHIVHVLHREGTVADRPMPHLIMTGADVWAVQVSTADKIVAIDCVLQRAARADDPASFWVQRSPFLERLPAFREFARNAAPYLPAPMTSELIGLCDQARSAAPSRRGG